RLRPDLRLVTPQPQQLRPDGLRAQRVAAPSQDLVRTEPLGQVVDLRRRTGVDAVQDAGPQRSQVGVGDKQTRADTADAQAGDGRIARVERELATDRGDLLPPDLFRVHLR